MFAVSTVRHVRIEELIVLNGSMHRNYNSVHFFKYKLFRETLNVSELGAGLTRCTCTHMPLGCAPCSLM